MLHATSLDPQDTATNSRQARSITERQWVRDGEDTRGSYGAARKPTRERDPCLRPSLNRASSATPPQSQRKARTDGREISQRALATHLRSRGHRFSNAQLRRIAAAISAFEGRATLLRWGPRGTTRVFARVCVKNVGSLESCLVGRPLWL